MIIPKNASWFPQNWSRRRILRYRNVLTQKMLYKRWHFRFIYVILDKLLRRISHRLIRMIYCCEGFRSCPKPFHPFSLRSILRLFSYLCLGLPVVIYFCINSIFVLSNSFLSTSLFYTIKLTKIIPLFLKDLQF